MGLFANPLGYAGYPPGVTGTPTTQNSTVRAATAAEAAAGTLTDVYVSPATADSATALDFASPPVNGFGSTTPRPVASTTLTSSGNTTLATGAAATTVSIANVAPTGARTGTYHGGNSAQNDTVSWLGGANTAGTQSFSVLNGISTGGTQTVGFLNGASTGVTRSFSVLNATGVGTINLGTGAATAHVLNIGNASALLGFYGAAAVTKPGSTSDIKDSLVSLGLITDGGATPLNLDGGAFTAGQGTITTSGATTGATINTAAGTGVGAIITTSAATVDALQLVTGSISVPAPSVAGASPVVNNVRTGQASFTDVIANGAYGTLTITNSIVSAASIIIASASCTTANSAVQIVDIVPGVGSVALRLFNAGAASTAANININFWVLN